MSDGNERLHAGVESSADAWPVAVLLTSDDDEVAFGDEDVSPFELGLDGLRDASGNAVAGRRTPKGRRGNLLPLAVGAAAIAAFVAVFSGAGEGPGLGGSGRVPSAESAASQPAQRTLAGQPDGAPLSGPTVLASDDAVPAKPKTSKKRKSSPAKDGPSAPAPGDGSGPPATSPGPTVAVPGVVEATVSLPGGSKATITLPGLPPVSAETPPIVLPPALPQLPLGGSK